MATRSKHTKQANLLVKGDTKAAALSNSEAKATTMEQDNTITNIALDQYIVGGQGMEGITAGEVVMDQQDSEDVTGTEAHNVLKFKKANESILSTAADDYVDVEMQDDDVMSLEKSKKLKMSTSSNAQKIWQHTKTIDLKSDLYKDKWTKIDGKAAICNSCRKIIKTRSSLQYHLGVAQCGPQCKEAHEHDWINKEFDSLK